VSGLAVEQINPKPEKIVNRGDTVEVTIHEKEKTIRTREG
jgi:ribosomal 50S subunit-recycling heat shock protein